MNRLLVFSALLAAIATVCWAQQRYSDRYDSIDLDAILRNDRLLKQYRDCLVADNDLRCTEEGKALKRVLADALKNDCARCTDKQKSGSRKTIKFLVQNKPEIWKDIAAKYDPEDTFLKTHPHILQ